jgi:hypothetical protein
MEAGVVSEQGAYQPDSFNGQVEAQLLQFTQIKKEFDGKSEKD